MKELFAALVKAQSEMKIATKDNLNPHFRNRYADFGSVYDAVKDALHRNGLAVIQPTRIHESGVTVVITKIIHTSGQSIEGEYPVIAKDMADAQKHGGGLTYARRYALASMLSVLQEDDDGNAAAGHTQAPATKPQAKPASNSMSDLFAAHKLAYPKAVEDLIGKPVAQWSENDKTTAREAIKKLQAGTPWSEIVKAAVFS
jgi:hypothetical protein